MHNIYDCVDSFASLLDTEYHFVLGRKGESVSLNQKKNVFSMIQADYVMKNQASWTLLYKEKITLSTGKSVVLYDGLKRM